MEARVRCSRGKKNSFDQAEYAAGGELGVEPSQFASAAAAIADLYGSAKQQRQEHNPKRLLTTLESCFRQTKADWSLALLRSVSDELRVGATRRNRSIDHEITWLSLTGYCLRPGFGFVGDPERIDEAWRVSQLGLAHRNDNRVKAQWWIFWRRIAAGLSVEQQTWLFEQGRSALGKAEGESTEVYRLLGALERVDAGLRLELAERIVERMVKGKGNEAAIWAFGRLATRVPLYAEPQSVIPGTRIEASIQRVAELNLRETRNAPVLQALQVAAKYSPYDENNLSPALRMAIESKLREAGVREIELRRIREFVPLESAEQRLLFGEALPLGLVL